MFVWFTETRLSVPAPSHEERTYMAALESASVRHGIGPVAALSADWFRIVCRAAPRRRFRRRVSRRQQRATRLSSRQRYQRSTRSGNGKTERPVNKDQLRKSTGMRVRLRPQAIGPRGGAQDDDWTIRRVEGDVVELVNVAGGHILIMGCDAVISFTSDPARNTDSTKFGFLQQSVQARFGSDGKAGIEPLPFGRGGGGAAPALSPLVVNDGSADRLFSWRGRDAVHRLPEEPAAQLMAFFKPLCDALRDETGREPEFCIPDRLNGDIVYEISPDLAARWPLLGGNGGRPGQQVLVLTARRAQYRGAHVAAPDVSAPNVNWVDIEYPARSGLKAMLEAEGYDIVWRRDDRPRADDAEPVTGEEHGMTFVFKVRDMTTALTLYKRRRSG
jgi:hypothetical protein